MALLFDATIRVLHIQEEDSLDTVQKYNLRSLRDYFKDCKVQLHWMPDYDKKSEEIQDFIEDVGVEMLAMLRYKPIIPFMVIPEYDG